MVTVIMEQPGPEVKCEQSEILLTLFGHWFHKLPELMELFTVKLVVVHGHMFSIEKLNFKASLFSCIF